MKGYKAFEKGMICKGKQYAENTVFEEEKAEICESGMHFCKKPLDVLNYYPLVDNDGNISEFAEVEALDEPKTNNGKKFCTKKLKIGAKISFAELVQASINFESEKITDTENQKTGNNNTHINSFSDNARIGTSSHDARIGSSGRRVQIGISGDFTHIGTSGIFAQIGTSGNDVGIGTSGDFAQIGSSGDDVQIGSSGDFARIGTSGYSAQIGSSGHFAQIGSSGCSAQIGTSGSCARIGISGDFTHIGSSGDFARIGSSGNGVQIKSTGKYAVICCAGGDCIAKGKIGSWITLSEWEYDKNEKCNIPICVKTERIDGIRIKEDTFYKLKNGVFVEVKGRR